MSHVSQNSCRGIKKRGGFALKYLIAKADVVIKSTATYVKYLIASARDLLIFIFYFILLVVYPMKVEAANGMKLLSS